MGKYQRKTERELHNEDALRNASFDVLHGSKLQPVAKATGFLRRTIGRAFERLKKLENLNSVNFKKEYDFKSVFSEEEERQLWDYLTTACAMHHSPARSICCKLAYELAVTKAQRYLRAEPKEWQLEENRLFPLWSEVTLLVTQPRQRA
ncbi:hypothetical protein QYM36_008213 [Artemia franciscana]|uniref:Uncharacterized protein n=1 Tax=Artemia franciscana TaxID=6661 RepID=A0AA88IPH1_ARTSF|nr:hypothetical protein QYM36_008213 [Artemia franciscana]